MSKQSLRFAQPIYGMLAFLWKLGVVKPPLNRNFSGWNKYHDMYVKDTEIR